MGLSSKQCNENNTFGGSLSLDFTSLFYCRISSGKFQNWFVTPFTEQKLFLVVAPQVFTTDIMYYVLVYRVDVILW